MSETTPTPEKRAYTIPEFCRVYSVSRPTAYRQMEAGRLAYVNPYGTKRLIPVEAAERWFLGSDPALKDLL